MAETEENPAISGDPHINGFNGDFFHFNGEDGKCFNLLSASNMQVNALFKGGSRQGGTTVQRVGIKLNKDQLEALVEQDGSLTVTFNGEPFPDKPPKGISKSRNTLSVSNGCYLTKVRTANDGEDFYYLNVYFNLLDDNGVLSDGVLPHGVVGQTADPERKPKTSSDHQGGGVIEGHYLDYMVSDLFADDFRFNRFGTLPDRKPKKGVFPVIRKASVSML